MPTDDAAIALGSALTAARDEAGLTVEKLSSETKIRATLIRDLEAGTFASSGGTVYARGHVKSIASSLHVDAAPLLALFDKAVGAASVPQAFDVPEPATLGSSEFALSSAAALRPERRGPRWGVALAGAAAILLVFIGIGQLGGKPGAKPATSLGVAQTPTTTPVQPTVSPSSAPLTAHLPPVTGAQLRVRVIGSSSWVSISNASATLFEGILKDGQFKDFHDAARLKVVVGFAPSVSLNCGGKDSGPNGSAGTVRKFYCTPTGLTSV